MKIEAPIKVMNNATLGYSSVRFVTNTDTGSLSMFFTTTEIELSRDELTEFLLRTSPQLKVTQ